MPVIVSKSEIVYRLENLISTGKKVILYYHDDQEILNLFCKGVAKRELLDIEIWYRADEEHNDAKTHTAVDEYRGYATDVPDYPFLKPIPSESMNEILDFYRLYDFSDKITIISESSQYGSLFNYVKNGILTPGEMAEAILCKM